MLLSVLPMAAGVAMGKGLQGSLYWGLSVINGGKDDETEATDSLVENTELSTISESEGTENRDGGSTVSASQVEALKKAAEEKLAEQAKEQQKPLKERLKEKFAAVRSSIRVNVMNVKPYIVEITLGSIVLLAALGSLMVLLREIDFAGVIFSTAFLSALYVLSAMCIPAAFAGIDGSKPLQHFPLLFGLFFMDAGSRCHRTSPDTMVEEKMGQQCCIHPYFSHSGFCCDIKWSSEKADCCRRSGR